MATITDEYMRDMLMKSREYSLVLLRRTAKRQEPGADAVVVEHARRNFSLRADGVLPIVCPVTDGGDWAGIGIFATSPEETAQLMAGDPGVQAGVFTFEVHPVRGFPGDSLPPFP